MINQLLNTMYHLNIQIKEIDYKTKLVYEPGMVDEALKEQIKKYKKGILHRMEENDIAKKQGFLVYNHGLMYEYRFGFGAFIFIERLPNGLSNAWRETYQNDAIRPHKVKVIAENVPFKRAFEEAQGFINWLDKKRGWRGA